MQNKPIKIVSLCLCFVLIFCTFSGCNKNQSNTGSATSSETVDNVSSTLSTTESKGEVTGGGGSKPRLVDAFAYYESGKPVFNFANLEGREGFSVEIIIKDGDKTVFSKTGIVKNKYVLEKSLTPKKEYTVLVNYTSPSGKKTAVSGLTNKGFKAILNENKGKYYFDGSISLETLNNYLNRAMTYAELCTVSKKDFEIHKQMLLDVGIKYVARAASAWPPTNREAQRFDEIKANAQSLHAADPDIILEACIFETITKKVEQIAVPDWVFKAFGLTPENRNFSYDKMLFEDGTYVNHWNTNDSVPDITRLETQMFFYYRARLYIDLGYEAFHLGQANLIGKQDEGNKCWTKVIGMIRDYAKTNARRHYVIIDAHYPSQKFLGSDGVMLADFNSFPIRLQVKAGQKNHKPTEENPQLCDIYPFKSDAVYQKGITGNSPSGYFLSEYPYMVEFDNWGVNKELLNQSTAYIWGYDEIGWWAFQPRWYRHEFVEYLLNTIDSFDENGHLALAGCRYMSLMPDSQRAGNYHCNDKTKFSLGFSDEAFYKELLKKRNK